MRLRLFENRPNDGLDATRQVLARVKSPQFAVYDLNEEHLVMAGDDSRDHRAVENKYRLSDDTIEDIAGENHNGDRFAVLAYDFERGDVYIIDIVPELQITAAIMMSIVSVVLESASGKVSKPLSQTRCYEAKKNEGETRKEDGGLFITNPLAGLHRLVPTNLVSF